jgi:hypothetical protein
MTSRFGLYLSLVGLGMAGLCLATLFLLRDWKDPEVNSVGEFMFLGMDIAFVLSLDLGTILGLILMVVGIVLALRRQSARAI